MPRFKDVPLGGCFQLGRSKAIHRKNSPETYIDDSVGEEMSLSGTSKVKAVRSCPVPKSLIELGNSRKRSS